MTVGVEDAMFATDLFCYREWVPLTVAGGGDRRGKVTQVLGPVETQEECLVR